MNVITLQAPKNFPCSVHRYGPERDQCSRVEIIPENVLRQPSYLLDSGIPNYALLDDAPWNICHWFTRSLATIFIAGGTPDSAKALLVNSQHIEHPHISESLAWFANAKLVTKTTEGLVNLPKFFNSYTVLIDNWGRYRHLVFPSVTTSFRSGLLPWLEKRYWARMCPRREDAILIQRRTPYGASPTTSRNIINRDEVVQSLAKEGYDLRIVFLEDLELVEQIATIYHARVIIGVHGAGLTHLLWASPDAKVVELHSDLTTNEPFACIALAGGLNYCQLQCKSGFAPWAPQGPDRPGGLDKKLFSHYVTVNVESLLVALEALEKRENIH